MAETQRQCLELMLPEGVEVIALPSFATARVRRLWCAASQMHVPLSAGRGDPPNPGCFAAPPVRFTETVREMVRRIEPIAAIATGQDKVYLAGSGQGDAALLNAAEIEAAAVARGFAIVRPDDLSFAEQVRLIRHAEFIVISEARQVWLSLFANPRTKLCSLLPDATTPLFSLALQDAIDTNVAVLEGVGSPDKGGGSGRNGHRIDPNAFDDLLDNWVGGRRPPPNASAQSGAIIGLEHCIRISEHVPGFARREEAWELARASFVLPPNPMIIEIGAFMGSGTILLAGARKLRGSGRVHAVDPFDGTGEPFSVPIYQRILGEAGGGSLREHFERNIGAAGLSDWVEVHQGRAADIAAHWATPVDMIFFDGDQSRAGVREAYDSWTPFLKPGGVILVHNSAPRHRPEQDGSWILVEEEIHTPHYVDIRLIHSMTVARNSEASAPRLFSYWDKPDLTPVQPTLDDWQSHFPEFTIFGDPDVEPIIEELFPQYLDLFRSIRIPTCKSDLALLLLLYKHGGLYVDCHCGVRDAAAIRELLASLDRWELILYDKDRRDAPRPVTALDPLNSVVFARPSSPIVLQALDTALTNLAAHRLTEREHGFQLYHIAALCGPGVLNDSLFADPESLIAELKPEFSGRALFIPEGDGEPIGRYMHYEYRQPGMHWSERQQQELLFHQPSRPSGPERVATSAADRPTPYHPTASASGTAVAADLRQPHLAVSSHQREPGARMPSPNRVWPLKRSVLLLAYNQAQFLAQALDSVLLQETEFEFEILAVDDASTDGTAELLHGYAHQHPNQIRLLQHPSNLGSERASFLGSYQRATGEYVALLDGDDFWTDPEKLQKQVNFMDVHHDYSFCAHNNMVIDEWNDAHWIKSAPTDDMDIPIETLIAGNPFHTSSVMYRNGVVTSWPEYFNNFEFSDWPLEILLAQRGRVRFMAEAMSAYRIHSGGTWSRKYRDRQSPAMTNAAGWSVIIDFWKVLNQHFDHAYDTYIHGLIDDKIGYLARQHATESPLATAGEGSSTEPPDHNAGRSGQTGRVRGGPAEK